MGPDGGGGFGFGASGAFGRAAILTTAGGSGGRSNCPLDAGASSPSSDASDSEPSPSAPRSWLTGTSGEYAAESPLDGGGVAARGWSGPAAARPLLTGGGVDARGCAPPAADSPLGGVDARLSRASFSGGND